LNLIVGGDGAIGSALANFWDRNDVPYMATTRNPDKVDTQHPYLNLASLDWGDLGGFQYDCVVFCAAVTKLAECEDNLVYSRLVNTVATIELAQFLSSQSRYMLLLSTNQVFDGSVPWRVATDEVCPVNEYGRQKAMAEKGFLEMSNVGVLRLTKVIYPDMPLLKVWRDSLLQGIPIDVYRDMYLSTAMIEDVVVAIVAMCQNGKKGIHHIVSGSDVSYYDFVLAYFSDLGSLDALVRGVSMPVNLREKFSYPRFSSLK